MLTSILLQIGWLLHRRAKILPIFNLASSHATKCNDDEKTRIFDQMEGELVLYIVYSWFFTSITFILFQFALYTKQNITVFMLLCSLLATCTFGAAMHGWRYHNIYSQILQRHKYSDETASDIAELHGRLIKSRDRDFLIQAFVFCFVFWIQRYSNIFDFIYRCAQR